MTPMLTVFSQGLSRSSAAAMELLGPSFGGIVVSDRFSAYNQLPLEQRQLCWAHIVRDLTAIAERPGASAEMGTRLLNLRHQLFEHWHRWNPHYQERCHPSQSQTRGLDGAEQCVVTARRSRLMSEGG